MQSFKNWLITTLLKKDKLVAVPENWQVDYIKTAADKIKNQKAVAELINEYNALLRDYYYKHSIKELQEVLKDNDIAYKTSMSKEELAELCQQIDNKVENGLSQKKKDIRAEIKELEAQLAALGLKKSEIKSF